MQNLKNCYVVIIKGHIQLIKSTERMVHRVATTALLLLNMQTQMHAAKVSDFRKYFEYVLNSSCCCALNLPILQD